MSNCFIYQFPGRTVRLWTLCEKSYLVAAWKVIEAIDELRTVIQPLSIDLALGCRDTTIQWMNYKITPQQPHWFISESSLPETIVIEPGFTNAQISQVSELSKDNIIAWIEKALQQECPLSDTNEVTWYVLEIRAVRARITNQSKFNNKNLFIAKHDRGNFKFPLEKRKDGVWVYSPIKDLLTQPSFSLLIGKEEARLTMDINIHWTLWAENSEDRNALKEGIQRIINKGWTLENASKEFELTPVKTN